MFLSFSRDIYLLFVVRMILSTGNFVFPFLTLYLSNKLNYSESRIGLIMFIATFFCLAGSTLGGLLADKFPRKIVVSAGLLASSLCYIIVPFLNKPSIIVIIISLSLGMLSFTEPGFYSLISDKCNMKDYKNAFSFIYLASNIGFAIGPLIASFLYSQYTNLLFFGDATSQFLACFIILFYLSPHESKEIEENEQTVDISKKEYSQSIPFLEFIKKNSFIVFFCLLYISHAFIYSQTNFSLPLLLNNLFKENAGPKLFGILMTINGIAIIVLTPIINKLTKKINSIKCVALGMFLYAIGFGSYFLINNYILIVVMLLFWSIGEILVTTNSKVFIAENTTSNNRSKSNTMLDYAVEIGYGAGPIFMGKLMVLYGIRSPWIAIFAIGITTGALLLIMQLQKNIKVSLTK